MSPRPGAAVEAATWVPLRVETVGPWRVGLSRGFTRRGNSALLAEGAVGAEAVAVLDDVERVYASAGHPTIVRLGTHRSPEPAPAVLTAELAARGYRTVSTTRVLAAEAAGGSQGPGDRAQREAPGPAGGPQGCGSPWPTGPTTPGSAGGSAPRRPRPATSDLDVARRLLTGSPARYLTATDADGVVGTIRAAVADAWVGLSCLVVEPRARRRGLGRHLTRAALGAHGGADRAFLQVEVRNTGALALYRGLGFVEVDEYTYAER